MHGVHLVRVGTSPIVSFVWDVDVTAVNAWLREIPFADWPQQHPVDHQLRPAMVNDLEWCDFGLRTDKLVARLSRYLPTDVLIYNRMLSVVMPGHTIAAHRDEQQAGWITRVHVPLTTNPAAFICMQRAPYHLEVGAAYTVDTRVEHEVQNNGSTPRIHFMFDVRRLP